MGNDPVDEMFEALFALTDLRIIFRETSPKHVLGDEQKKQVEEILERVRSSIEAIEAEMLK